eukprot:ctg_227.g129
MRVWRKRLSIPTAVDAVGVSATPPADHPLRAERGRAHRSSRLHPGDVHGAVGRRCLFRRPPRRLIADGAAGAANARAHAVGVERRRRCGGGAESARRGPVDAALGDNTTEWGRRGAAVAIRISPGGPAAPVVRPTTRRMASVAGHGGVAGGRPAGVRPSGGWRRLGRGLQLEHVRVGHRLVASSQRCAIAIQYSAGHGGVAAAAGVRAAECRWRQDQFGRPGTAIWTRLPVCRRHGGGDGADGLGAGDAVRAEQLDQHSRSLRLVLGAAVPCGSTDDAAHRLGGVSMPAP